jgi:hypothetical protein
LLIREDNKNPSIRVTYLGWVEKFDEDRKLSNSIVVPFRGKTGGYTGPKKRKVISPHDIDHIIIELISVILTCVPF